MSQFVVPDAKECGRVDGELKLHNNLPSFGIKFQHRCVLRQSKKRQNDSTQNTRGVAVQDPWRSDCALGLSRRTAGGWRQPDHSKYLPQSALVKVPGAFLCLVLLQGAVPIAPGASPISGSRPLLRPTSCHRLRASLDQALFTLCICRKVAESHIMADRCNHFTHEGASGHYLRGDLDSVALMFAKSVPHLYHCLSYTNLSVGSDIRPANAPSSLGWCPPLFSTDSGRLSFSWLRHVMSDHGTIHKSAHRQRLTKGCAQLWLCLAWH